MKKLWLTTLTVLALIPAMVSAKTDYTEGKQYVRVPAAAVIKTEGPVLTEYFSFYCGGCYNFERYLAVLLPKLDKKIRFEKSHVDFMQHAPAEIQQALSRAYLVAKAAGRAEEGAKMIFDYIHQSRASFANETDIRNLFVMNNFDGAAFDKQFVSMPVLAGAMQMKQNQELLSKHEMLHSVPTLIVNGQFKINVNELDQADPITDLANLIQYLSTLK